MLGFLKVVLVIIDVVCALLLIGIILIQKSKNEGMGGLSFGAGMGEALFGSRTGNVLTRATITLAITFMVTTVLLGVITPKLGSGSSSIIDDTVPDIPPNAAGRGPAPTAPAPSPGGTTLPQPEAPAAPILPAPATAPEAAAAAAPAAAPAAPAPAPAPKP